MALKTEPVETGIKLFERAVYLAHLLKILRRQMLQQVNPYLVSASTNPVGVCFNFPALGLKML